jgi:hypothetical protein
MYEEAEYSFANHIVPLLKRDFFIVFLIGFITGSIIWTLERILSVYIFIPLFCSGGNCAVATQTAYEVATLSTAALGLAMLIRYRLPRPLLIVIAVTIALWGLSQLPFFSTGIVSVISMMVLYGLSYSLFMWIMRIRNSYIVAFLSVGIVIVTRLILLS